MNFRCTQSQRKEVSGCQLICCRRRKRCVWMRWRRFKIHAYPEAAWMNFRNVQRQELKERQEEINYNYPSEFWDHLKSLSTQKFVFLLVPWLWCLIFTVQNDLTLEVCFHIHLLKGGKSREHCCSEAEDKNSDFFFLCFQPWKGKNQNLKWVQWDEWIPSKWL